MIPSCPNRLFMQVRAIPFLCGMLILSGCMTERVQPLTEYPSVPKQTTFMVQQIDYDEYGRPLFQKKLDTRPVSAGEQFTLVHAVNERPVRSYDIAIIAQEQVDMRRPLEVVYEWTGRGFEAGYSITGNLFRGHVYASGNEALAVVAVEAAPIIIGGVAGFVFGVLASLPETAIELRHVIVNARELVMGYTVYEYDEKGRIRFMKLYPPMGHAEELVNTEFHYSGDSDIPSGTEVTSRVEKKIRRVH
jgi:hypothetical protein